MHLLIKASKIEFFFDRLRQNFCSKLPRFLGVFLAGIILFSAGLLPAQVIDVDFNNDSGGATHGGPSVGPNMSGAAVLGTAGDQWNGISVANGSGLSLFYVNGTVSPVTMSFTSGGGYDVKAYSGSTPFAGTAYNSLMEDYLYSGNTPQTITLSGLATNSAYKLVLYNAADTAGAGRKTVFTVNGNTQTSLWDGTSSTLLAGVDYVYFSSAFSDGSGNLVIIYTGSAGAEGDINGFQIQGPVLCSASFPDDFRCRATLSGGNTSVMASNVGATKEPGEPNHGGNAGGASLWWDWVAPFTGGVTLTTAGSDFDTLLGVYTGTNVSTLTSVASDGRTNLPDSVTFAATAGVDYKIAVDGTDGATGNILLNLTLLAQPANDNFSNSISVATGSVIVGQNLGATSEPGNPTMPAWSGVNPCGGAGPPAPTARRWSRPMAATLTPWWVCTPALPWPPWFPLLPTMTLTAS